MGAAAADGVSLPGVCDKMMPGEKVVVYPPIKIVRQRLALVGDMLGVITAGLGSALISSVTMAAKLTLYENQRCGGVVAEVFTYDLTVGSGNA